MLCCIVMFCIFVFQRLLCKWNPPRCLGVAGIKELLGRGKHEVESGLLWARIDAPNMKLNWLPLAYAAFLISEDP